MSTQSTPERCGCRRHAPTNLRCSRCDALICPDCSVVGAVGMLCRSCGDIGKSPLFAVSPGRLALAYAACLAVALVVGHLLGAIGGFGFFGLWGAFLCGLAVGETALRVTGRKRGRKIEALVLICSLLGMLGSPMLAALPNGISTGLLVLFLSPFRLLGVGIACFAAVARIRNI